MDRNEDIGNYRVLRNHEEQYCIWPEHSPVPAGWTAVGPCGPKAEALAYVKTVWTDMRPLSLRNKMAQSVSP